MKDKIIVGYDLGNRYSQISYCTYENDEPETLSVIAGGESYNIPTALCKRKGVNQWFYGKDAYKHAEEEEGGLITDLLELARAGEKVQVEEEEFDPVALLTLYMKRSLTLLSMVSGIDRIGAMMITCENLDGRMVEILNAVVAGLSLKTKDVYFQGHVESFYYYTIHQPAELWARQVVVCDYNDDYIKMYRMECNRRTTPVVAFVDEETYPFMPCGELAEDVIPAVSKSTMDGRFLTILKEVCEGRMITSAYLIGEGFKEEWMEESLRYLCRGRRVFQGNNLYSKGACYGMREKLFASEIGKTHVFLGNEKLKANIGMKVFRQGEKSYCALLDAGISWFDAFCETEFYLEGDNSFELIITPLNGRDVKYAKITLEGLPVRTGAASKLYMEIKMSSENCIEIEIEDLGFGEIYPATGLRWIESFEVV